MIIHRSVSEKSREKCTRSRINSGNIIVECRHRTPSRKHRECRHTESKLRQQARLEYVQSNPNVATTINNKFTPSVNPRGDSDSGSGAGCNNIIAGGSKIDGGHQANESEATKNNSFTAIPIDSRANDGASSSTADMSKMCSAVSDGELLDLEILPIFQKLLCEREKNANRTGYGGNIASCPNISIKCDIVEYL
ncbi:hypothetical protein PV325_001605 [Microctonus aethiopoides]|nr:hypothetical protein PV325_001605 [Microctonus aethiopoides]